MKYQELVLSLINQPIAIHEHTLRSQLAVELSEQAIAELAVRANPRAAGAVAVIPLLGVIQQREDIWTRMGFATSSTRFAANVTAAAQDPNVKAIVLDVDSPGGVVSGTPEAADVVYSLRGTKPIIAVSNGLDASAAYWITSAADEVISSPSSYTGSIGVWTLLADETEFWANLGIKLDMVKAGKWKAIGNPWERVTEEVRERFQSSVNASYDLFVKAVARNRGAKAADVRAGYGEGDILNATEAKAAGLVDRIATLDETIARFGGATSVAASLRAAAQRDLARARFLDGVA